jgi:hypothetical protein
MQMSIQHGPFPRSISGWRNRSRIYTPRAELYMVDRWVRDASYLRSRALRNAWTE